MNFILSYFFGFEGRIGRGSWWLGMIILFLVNVANAVIMGLLENGPALIPNVIIAFALLWPWLAIMSKRWHDRGKSGVWTLITFIPLVGVIWAIVECGFLAGKRGGNKFGEIY